MQLLWSLAAHAILLHRCICSPSITPPPLQSFLTDNAPNQPPSCFRVVQSISRHRRATQPVLLFLLNSDPQTPTSISSSFMTLPRLWLQPSLFPHLLPCFRLLRQPQRLGSSGLPRLLLFRLGLHHPYCSPRQSHHQVPPHPQWHLNRYVLGLSDLEYSFSLVTKSSNSCCRSWRRSRLFFCSSGLYLAKSSSSVGETYRTRAGPPQMMPPPLLGKGC